MRTREAIYDAGLRAAEPVVQLLSRLHPKGAAAMRGRRDSAARFAAWSRSNRDRRRPLVLVHAPSVGEALMAQAIIERVRSHTPDAQIAFTFFSPSAERMAHSTGADIAGYLPFDTRSHMRSLVRQLDPTVVAFVRTEIWPMLGIEAEATGAACVLVNAVLAATSSRVRGGARYLLGPAYRRLLGIGAVAAGDAERFSLFGVSPDRVFVTGDARFDQVWKRVQLLDRESTLLDSVRDARPIIVAGSTWPADEEFLVDAYMTIAPGNRPRMIVAPHEPTDSHLASLEATLAARGVLHTRLSTVELAGGTSADVIVVDRVGILADLYAAATIAYVGGGFGDRGLHSVIEPAALGVPVVYGPRHGNAREAGDLAAVGGGFIIRDAAQMADRMRRLLGNATARSLAGTAASAFVQSRLGGADANAALITASMNPASRQAS